MCDSVTLYVCLRGSIKQHQPEMSMTWMPMPCSCCTTCCASALRVSLNPNDPTTPCPSTPTYTTLCPALCLLLLLLLLLVLLLALPLLLLVLADEEDCMRSCCCSQSRRPTATLLPSTVAVTPQPGSVVLSLALGTCRNKQAVMMMITRTHASQG